MYTGKFHKLIVCSHCPTARPNTFLYNSHVSLSQFVFMLKTCTQLCATHVYVGVSQCEQTIIFLYMLSITLLWGGVPMSRDPISMRVSSCPTPLSHCQSDDFKQELLALCFVHNHSKQGTHTKIRQKCIISMYCWNKTYVLFTQGKATSG